MNTWTEYKDAEYHDTLAATAWTWVCLLEARLAGAETRGAVAAYDRATLALTQLPMEHGKYGSAKRFERCRWASPDVDGQGHAEHPWSKRITKELIWKAGSAALSRGVDRTALVGPISLILDARQDAVLLPHARVTQLGVLSDRAGDGLAGRYRGALESGSLVLIDRASGTPISPERADEIDAAASRQVSQALEVIRQLPGRSA